MARHPLLLKARALLLVCNSQPRSTHFPWPFPGLSLIDTFNNLPTPMTIRAPVRKHQTLPSFVSFPQVFSALAPRYPVRSLPNTLAVTRRRQSLPGLCVRAVAPKSDRVTRPHVPREVLGARCGSRRSRYLGGGQEDGSCLVGSTLRSAGGCSCGQGCAAALPSEEEIHFCHLSSAVGSERSYCPVLRKHSPAEQ